MSTRPAERPSLGVVLAGGFGVVVVVAFVAAVAFGARSRSTPGAHVDVVRGSGPAGMVVLAGRCTEQRVTGVVVRNAGGSILWQVSSAKGSIERRYVVGGDPPLGFSTVTPLRTRPAGRLLAEVHFDRDGAATSDVHAFDSSKVTSSRVTLGDAAPPCAATEGPGATAWLFAVGAAFVVAGYVGMLLRFVRGRGPG
jgi:hypothetical protein